MKKRTRVITTAGAGTLALIALTTTAMNTFALWSDETQTTQQVLTAAKVQLSINGAPDWTMPAAVLESITPDTPQAIPLTITGVSEGNRGLKYSMQAPTITGVTGLTGVLHSTVTTEATAADCSAAAVTTGVTLYDGPFAGTSVAMREIVDALPTTTTGEEVLCLRLSLPTDYGDYVNTATVTAESSSGQVTATTEWHGVAAPSAADRAASVMFEFTKQSFRPTA